VRKPSRTRHADALRVTGPPPSRPIRPRLQVAPADSRLLRIYSPEPYRTGPTTFRAFGPANARFDHHRSSRSAPAVDPDCRILYAAPDLVCALGERFGDEGTITLSGNRLARLRLTRDIALLDLRGLAARAAGTIPAIGSVGEREITQAWSRWWHDHAALSRVDGLIYTSAQTGLDCIALWQRAEDAIDRDGDWPLGAPEIRDDLELAADELDLAPL
jgi:hypothetical protein